MTATLPAVPTLREGPEVRRWRLWVHRFWGDRTLLARLGAIGVAAVVVVSVVLRFYQAGDLWLDEAISVNISKLSLGQIPVALSHDGAPPLYYYMLHFWMLLFGEGNFAVRAFSGLASVASLPAFWAAGKRLGGRKVGRAALLLGATSPFAIQYATDTRMYSLMVFLVLLGFLALIRALEHPTRGRLFALGTITAALLYTHYWALYLVMAVGAWLLVRLWRDAHGRRPARVGSVFDDIAHPSGPGPAPLPPAKPAPEVDPSRQPLIARRFRRHLQPRTVDGHATALALRAIVLGSLTFLPWSPVFVFQALHTGTPWTSAPGPADLLKVLTEFDGTGPWGQLLTYVLFALLVFALFGRAAVLRGRASLVLDFYAGRRRWPLFLVVALTLVIAVVLGMVADAAFVSRYTAVVFPLFILLVAVGATRFPDRRLAAIVLAVACLAGTMAGYAENRTPRTEAAEVAAVLNVQARPGDLVVFCPDQLGPAVNRLITVPGVTQLTFPRAIAPERVDWVNYREVIEHTDVEGFAQDILSKLGSNSTLWLVWRNGYPGLGGDCGYLESWFSMLRGGTGQTLVRTDRRYFEFENLTRYPNS